MYFWDSRLTFFLILPSITSQCRASSYVCAENFATLFCVMFLLILHQEPIQTAIWLHIYNLHTLWWNGNLTAITIRLDLKYHPTRQRNCALRDGSYESGCPRGYWAQCQPANWMQCQQLAAPAAVFEEEMKCNLEDALSLGQAAQWCQEGVSPASFTAAGTGSLPFPSCPHDPHRFGSSGKMPWLPLGRGMRCGGTLRPGPSWTISE